MIHQQHLGQFQGVGTPVRCPARLICSHPSRRSARTFAGNKGGDLDVSSLLAKYAAGNPPANSKDGDSSAQQPRQPALSPKAPAQVAAQGDAAGPGPSSLLQCSIGVGALLAVNFGVYALAVWGGKASSVAGLVLAATGGTWWQYLSSAFVHASLPHLTRNLGIIWLSSVVVRKEITSLGIWFTYALCAAGANISAMMLMPAKVKTAGGLLGVGATGATAGLALTALLLGLRPTIGSVLAGLLFIQLTIAPLLALPVPGGPSAAIPSPHSLIGAFFSQGGWPGVFSAAKDALTGAAADPGLTWFWGAAAASLLVVLIARFPDAPQLEEAAAKPKAG